MNNQDCDILIVEDNQATLEQLEGAIHAERDDLIIETVNTYQACMDYLKNNIPVIIIADFHLDEDKGALDIFAHMDKRQEDFYDTIKVLTATNMDETMCEGIKEIFNIAFCIDKPMNESRLWSELIEKINKNI